jgi:tRNA(fMet)-specific endonuclease VapC
VKPSLIDTDIFSFILKKDKSVLENALKYQEKFQKFNISIITYYEVLSGLKYLGASSKIAKLEHFIRHNNLIGIDKEAVRSAANIYAYLLQEGLIISQADILIAGIAKSKNLVLVTNNISHFERIPELVIENWHLELRY